MRLALLLLRDAAADVAVRVALIAALVVGVAMWLSGCGATAAQTSARSATMAAVAVQGAARVIEAAAAADLEATCPRAQYPTQAEAAGCEAAHGIKARWRPADAAIAVVKATLSQWVETTRTAAAAGDDGALWGAFALQAARLVADYEALRVALGPLGVSLPGLPPMVVELAGRVTQ